MRDALLGGDAKDADFLVPGVDIEGLREALAPHGWTEELVVAERPVGVRFFPRDKALRKRVPAGIEIAPPRREVSTGPGRHDFDIVVDPAASVEVDLARRDFTVNAMARRLDDDTLVDPFGGKDDLAQRVLRTVSPRSFEEDPLRIVRGLRFVSQLGFDQQSRYHDLTVDEHTFAVVQATADAGAPLHIRLAALFHDVGKPEVAWRGTDGRLHFYRRPGYSDRSHEDVSADLAASALSRLRYPNELRKRVIAIVRGHMFSVGKGDELRARRMLARYGDELTFDLIDHKHADLLGKRGLGEEPPTAELEELERFRRVVERARKSPHRLADLAVDGNDLIELGYAPGPAIGRTLRDLLKDVVDDPGLNTRETLLGKARQWR